MTDNRDAHAEIKRALLPVLMDEYGGTEEDWTAMRSLTHVAVALLPVVARIKADAAAETIAAALAEIEALPTTRTQAWLKGWDSVSLADVRAALPGGRTALDTRLAQAWDEGYRAVDPNENPYRAEASGEGQ